MQVPDVAVATDTGNLIDFILAVRNRDRLDHLLMTVATGFFGHAQIAAFDLDRLVKTAEREIIGMPEAVRSLDGVFADRVVRRVAVVAGRDGVMARFLPAVVLLLHDVTIGAGARIVAHVGIALGIDERVKTDADCQTKCDSDNN